MRLEDALEGVFREDVHKVGLQFDFFTEHRGFRYNKFGFYYPTTSISTPFFVQHDLAHCLAMCFLHREHRLFHEDFLYNKPGAVSPHYNLVEEYVALEFQSKFTKSFGSFGNKDELRDVVSTALANKVCQLGNIHKPATCEAILQEMRKNASEHAACVTDESVAFMAAKLENIMRLHKASGAVHTSDFVVNQRING